MNELSLRQKISSILNCRTSKDYKIELLEYMIKNDCASASEWVSVNDRLPEEDSLVVAACFYYVFEPDACVCDFYNGKFTANTDGISSEYDNVADITMDFKPTHWMPLPEPPKA